MPYKGKDWLTGHLIKKRPCFEGFLGVENGVVFRYLTVFYFGPVSLFKVAFCLDALSEVFLLVFLIFILSLKS